MPPRKNLHDVLGIKRDPLDDLFDKRVAKTSSNLWGGSCYETHPPLVLPNGRTVYGGSCGTPAVKDADIYIGFDGTARRTARAYPWTPGHEFLFPIRDMATPADPDAFRQLVDWTLGQLDAGAKVHCGCIGGHGRTGTFLCALVAETGEKDAISYVRKNYCPKAVETRSQTDFLVDQFGVKAVKGSKETASKPSTAATFLREDKEPILATYDPASKNSIW